MIPSLEELLDWITEKHNRPQVCARMILQCMLQFCNIQPGTAHKFGPERDKTLTKK